MSIQAKFPTLLFSEPRGKFEPTEPDGSHCRLEFATRGLGPTESIQICYARPAPNTIPHKPVWRVGIRVVAYNNPALDAVFQLRVSVDGSLVGTLLNGGESAGNPELAGNPLISVELVTDTPIIGDFVPVCAIRITNTGPELNGKCLVQLEDHEYTSQIPDPLVLRTEGQIRANRTGRFTLSAGQPKLVPVLYREQIRKNQFRFIGEDGTGYPFTDSSAKFVAAIYGAATPTRVRISLRIGPNWNVNAEMEVC